MHPSVKSDQNHFMGNQCGSDQLYDKYAINCTASIGYLFSFVKGQYSPGFNLQLYCRFVSFFSSKAGAVVKQYSTLHIRIITSSAQLLRNCDDRYIYSSEQIIQK